MFGFHPNLGLTMCNLGLAMCNLGLPLFDFLQMFRRWKNLLRDTGLKTSHPFVKIDFWAVAITLLPSSTPPLLHSSPLPSVTPLHFNS